MKDEKDRKIVQMLRQNARTSNVEIAQAVQLTEGAVRARIERLLKNGTITRFTIETSNANEAMAVVMVKAKSNTKAMMRDISGLGVVQQAYEVAGAAYDACTLIAGEDITDIDRKVDLIRELKTVKDTRTHVVVKIW